MRESYRKALLAAAAAAALVVAWFLDPIPQDPAYHDFADRRAFRGVPNFWNVASNLPFLIAGVLALVQSGRVAARPLRFHYLLFCAAVAMVSVGSACYHLEPSTPALAWDRLPMTVAFMTLLSAVLADRMSWLLGRALLWPLTAFGIASIAWWMRTEYAGAGDLRAYGLVQFLPVLLIPLTLLLWRKGSLDARPLWAALAVYAAAKVAELSDASIFDATGFVSGHTFKHLLAALAAWLIVRSFQISPARTL